MQSDMDATEASTAMAFTVAEGQSAAAGTAGLDSKQALRPHPPQSTSSFHAHSLAGAATLPAILPLPSPALGKIRQCESALCTLRFVRAAEGHPQPLCTSNVRLASTSACFMTSRKELSLLPLLFMSSSPRWRKLKRLRHVTTALMEPSKISVPRGAEHPLVLGIGTRPVLALHRLPDRCSVSVLV